MSRRLAAVWAFTLLTLAGPLVRAQNPFPRDLIPTRTALARLGLERQWFGVVPLNQSERVAKISRSSDLLFALTDQGGLHTFDAETGKLLWSADLGGVTPYAHGVSSNSYMVFGTSGEQLSALDRKTGRLMWRKSIDALPSCGTVADEDRVIVGTINGRVFSFKLRKENAKGAKEILSDPIEEFRWQTQGPVHTLPVIAAHMIAFGSSDGRVYVSMTDERTMLYRVRTGGPIGNGLGDFGTRSLLIPSADDNLYAVDLLTAKNQWIFPSGAPISQAPIIANDDIYVINDAGALTLLDPATGSPRWTAQTQGGRFVALGEKKIYLRSHSNDLLIVDRASGQVLADSNATHLRAGLNLREYDLEMLNRFDDRIYFGTRSGMIVCLREIGADAPRILRNPKDLPFGYIPPEGLKPAPNQPEMEETPEGDNAVPPADGETEKPEGEADPDADSFN